MNSILLMVKSNLKRRKIQTLTIGVSIAIVSLLFSTSIGIMTGMQQPFDKVFNNLNASHILLLYDYRSDKGKAMINWFSNQPEVEMVGKPDPYYNCNGPVFFNEEKIDVIIQITEFTAGHRVQDKLKIISGEPKEEPGYDEIWLPNYLALQHHIGIGDTISIPASGGVYKFRVSATVSDPHYGSGMVNPTRAWVRAGTLSFFAPVSQLTNNCLGIRLKSPGLIEKVLDRFNRNFNYAGTVLTYNIFKSAFMSTYQLIGGVLLIFSILGLIIPVYLINTAISKSIYDDYKLTGVLKTLGLTPRNTILIYVMQSVLPAILFIAAGLTGTYFILNLIMQSIMRTIGLFDLNLRLSFVFSISFFVLLLIVLLTTLSAAFKAGKIRPAQAIRFGIPEKSSRHTRGRGMNPESFLPLLLSLSIRFTSGDRRRTGVTFGVLLFTVFLLVFSVNISSSLEGLKYNKPAWGFENGDILLSRNTATPIGFTHQNFKEMLQNEKGISSVMPFSYESLTILSNEGNQRLNLFGKVYEGNISKVGLVNLSGTHPAGENEISLCIGTSKLLNKIPGDSIRAFIEGQKINFKITGVYQDISNMGQGFRLQSNAIRKLNPVYTPGMYSLKLSQGEESGTFKNYLLNKLGSTISIDTNIEDRIAQMGIISNMKITFLFISLFFITIMFLSIWNDIIISIRDFRRIFGILKTTGFTPKQIRILLTWKMIILSSLALFISIPVSLWLSPVVMSQVTKNLGLVHFPFIINSAGTLLIAPLFFCMVLFFTWGATSGAAKVNPRLLIVE